MLTFKDVKSIIPNTGGITGLDAGFRSVSVSSAADQPKGLFVKLCTEASLQEAISRGAIAAVWPAGDKLPSFAPNHFPVFYAENPYSALRAIALHYREKLKLKPEECGEMTLFTLQEKNEQNIRICHPGLKSGWQEMKELLNISDLSGQGGDGSC